MKFLVPNYSCLQIPILSLLCPQLNLLNPLRKKFLGTPLAGGGGCYCHCRYRYTC